MIVSWLAVEALANSISSRYMYLVTTCHGSSVLVYKSIDVYFMRLYILFGTDEFAILAEHRASRSSVGHESEAMGSEEISFVAVDTACKSMLELSVEPCIPLAVL